MKGRALGLDFGHKRVGVAISDELRIAAHALMVVPRREAPARVADLVEEYGVIEIVIGLPTSLSGQEGESARAARDFGREIEEATGLAVTWVDERFTSKDAERVMLEAGTRRRARRANLDKVAATVILQSFLDRRR
ncbi:MAG TPA: Holliday junction resolvase RuvX [Acidimicrobiia bacterium]|nr:Holliday junction resolvase RuvX [Acidimicrobiia bacterium]